MYWDLSPQYDSGWGGRTMLATILYILLPLTLPSILMIPPMWNLCGRAGFPRWFSFAIVIPLANLTLLYFLAFSQWPSQLRQHEQASGGNRDATQPPA
jgi:hypothetical protein